MLTSTGSIWEKLTKPKRYKSLTAIDSTSNRPIGGKKKKQNMAESSLPRYVFETAN